MYLHCIQDNKLKSILQYEKEYSFVVLSLTVSNIFAQNDWRNGYIINNNRDTIYGLIDYRDSRSNSKECFFKKELKDQRTIYTPSDLFGYRFEDGKYFVSKSISKIDPSKTHFLEFVVKGKVNLYHYQDNTDHYYIEKDTLLKELVNSEVIVPGTKEDENGRSKSSYDRQVNRNEYIGVLTYQLRDANLQSEIEQTSLETSSLIKLVKKYHYAVCTDEECIVYEKSFKPIKFNFGYYFGIANSFVNFGNEIKSNGSVSKQFGLRMELENVVEWQERIGIVVDIALQHYSKYNLYLTPTGNPGHITYNKVQYILTRGSLLSIYDISQLDVALQVYSLKIPVSINYTFSKKRFRPYIATGIGNTFIISQNKNFIYETFYSEFNKSIPTYQFGLVESIGCKWMMDKNNYLYLEATYELNKSYNVNQFLRFTNNMYGFKIGYSL